MTLNQVDQVLIWIALAFCLWLLLSQPIQRLQIPGPVVVSAALSWLVARLFIWGIPVLLHQITSWTLTLGPPPR